MTTIHYTPANLILACDYIIAKLDKEADERGERMLGRKHNEFLQEREGKEIKRVSQMDWEMWSRELEHGMELRWYFSSVREPLSWPKLRRRRRHYKNKHRIAQLESLLMHVGQQAKAAECDGASEEQILDYAYRLVREELGHYLWTEGQATAQKVRPQERTEEVGLDILRAPEPNNSSRTEGASTEMDDEHLRTVPGMGGLPGGSDSEA